LLRLPDLIRRIEAQFPAPGAAPPPPPLPNVALVGVGSRWQFAAALIVAALVGAAIAVWLS